MKKGPPLFLSIAAAVFISLSFSCEKQNRQETAGTGETGLENGTAISENTKQMTEKPKETLTMELEGSGTGADPEGSTPQPPQPLPGKEFLLSTIAMLPVAGEDMVIGRLENVYTAEESVLEIHRVIEKFLQALTEARVAEELSHPEWKEPLLRSVWYHIEVGNIPNDFRIGEITDDEDRGWADIRLFSVVGRTAGEIYLARTGNGWFVTDLQMDLAELSRPYENTGHYEPNVYRWVHQY